MGIQRINGSLFLQAANGTTVIVQGFVLSPEQVPCVEPIFEQVPEDELMFPKVT